MIEMNLRLMDYNEGVEVFVQKDYDPRELDLEFVDLKYSKPLSMEGTVEKGADTLVFRGQLTSEIERICGRCLKHIPTTLEQPFELYYEIQGKEFVDTTDDLREVLILEHPIIFVCQENCKGLCPQCGINLNEGNCRCAPKPVPARGAFVQLKQLWEKKQEKKNNA